MNTHTRDRSWAALARQLPPDLRSDVGLLKLMAEGDGAAVVARLEEALAGAQEDRRAFVNGHARLKRLSERDYWWFDSDDYYDLDEPAPLSDVEKAEVEWFREQVYQRDQRIKHLQRIELRARELM